MVRDGRLKLGVSALQNDVAPGLAYHRLAIGQLDEASLALGLTAGSPFVLILPRPLNTLISLFPPRLRYPVSCTIYL